ncbi:DUF3995 domain-containing protein [Microbacterium sp. NPDC091382]|uniref:DUF3995 domain-containing protein n=1 Tax=Microbacterium sp. NPDC091382 TaxID=3364210 RepID=UPI00380EAE01
MTSPTARSAGVAAWIAFAAGMTHAAVSAYWALGGRLLLDTVGPWAEELGAEAPILSGLLLGVIAIAKILASVFPILVLHDRLLPVRLWRAACWVGGGILLAYGGVNALVANAVLLGAVRTGSGYDPPAMIGHAYLWDPLFAVWGAAVITAMWFSKPIRNVTR